MFRVDDPVWAFYSGYFFYVSAPQRAFFVSMGERILLRKPRCPLYRKKPAVSYGYRAEYHTLRPGTRCSYYLAERTAANDLSTRGMYT